jgi:hypothetical protein
MVASGGRGAGVAGVAPEVGVSTPGGRRRMVFGRAAGDSEAAGAGAGDGAAEAAGAGDGAAAAGAERAAPPTPSKQGCMG